MSNNENSELKNNLDTNIRFIKLKLFSITIKYR